MAEYDYISGKKRVQNILLSELEVISQDELPTDDQLTFSNAYKSWVTGIFIDIRDSTTLFTKDNKKDVSRIIRSFTSEIIDIINRGSNLREIGIRGDCVYGIYTTPKKDDISEILDMGFYINTLMRMLNKLFEKENITTLQIGIGISTAQELVVKTGRKGSGINNKVWIGDAVTKASNLSSLGSKNGNSAIIISQCTYDNIIDKHIKNNGEESRSWFTQKNDVTLGKYYSSGIIKSEFNNWINNGMKE